MYIILLKAALIALHVLAGGIFTNKVFVHFLIDKVGGIGTAPLFDPICDKHDICYSTPNEPQDACDLALLQGLQQVCYGVYGNLNPSHPLLAGYNAIRLPPCLADAVGVYQVLRFDQFSACGTSLLISIGLWILGDALCTCLA